MATWKQVSGEALTTERRVRVFDVADLDREGYVDVSWSTGGPTGHGPRFVGVVYDDAGERTILDRTPEFDP